MTQPSYPPPPPPAAPQEKTLEKGFHGPKTNWFRGIRRHLTLLEKQLPSSMARSTGFGLISALILGATVSVGLSVLFELLVGISPAAVATVDPFLEEIFKGFSMVLVALFIWKAIPSRRYGAALGASTGLGFAIVENFIYSAQYASSNLANVAELILSRWIGLPFMHVLWDAFVGIGIFVVLAQRSGRQNSPIWLAAPFLLLGLIAHMLWNSIAIALSGIGVFAVILIDIVVVFVPFSLMLRDFLGGHFNFQDFSTSLPEPVTVQALTVSAPPPPPPPPTF